MLPNPRPPKPRRMCNFLTLSLSLVVVLTRRQKPALYAERPSMCRAVLRKRKESGGDDAPTPVHHFGFEFGLEGLDLAEDGETAGGAAHLALQLAEDFVQALSGGPKSGVVLSR